MATKNSKSVNSSDSENEWTFIDSYDCTIETRNNCVTYRKPTYSEAVRGVSEEELAEVESEPEFEVLASFQFRPKGESFGVGSSAPREKLSPITQQKAISTESSESDHVDEDVFVISSQQKRVKPVYDKEDNEDDRSNTDDSTTSGTDDAIVVVDQGFGLDDVIDDDDDDLIDLGVSCNVDTDGEEMLNTSFINTSLNNICIYDDDDDGDDKFDDDDDIKSSANDWLRCIDTLESNKDLAWDNLTFKLMNPMPLMMVSTSALERSECQSSSEDSFEPISDSDGTSSYDNLDDLSDDNANEQASIPEWFFKNNSVDSNDDNSFILVDGDCEPMIPDWFYSTSLETTDNVDCIVPEWFFNPYHDPCKDLENVNEPLIPEWLHDPNHSTFDGTFDESDFSDYSEYTDDSEDDYDSDDDSVVAIPDWLFSERKESKQNQDDDGFLFSHLFVDVPTFIILLFLTTALGFSIGHGLTVYLSSHSINRNSKVQAPTAQSFNSHPNQNILTAEEIAKIDLIKLEDELYRQRESELLASHLRYDLKNIYKTLQEKHNRLMRNHKSTEDRLHVTKSMSWFWRSKYDRERRRNENSTSIIYLQQQLEKIGALYNKEKKVANKWRRFKKTRLSSKKNESSERNPLKGKLYDTKVSLASKYWVKAILSSRAIDFAGFKKRWTRDLNKLKDQSCESTKLSMKDVFQRTEVAKNESLQVCERGKCLFGDNGTIQKSTKHVKKKVVKNSLQERVFRSNIPSPVGHPVGPPKMVKRPLMFGSINIERKSSNGRTARRRQEEIRNERLKKREARKQSLQIESQLKEMKRVIAELRKERRSAEKEKFRLEASWRKLKKQREMFEKEKVQKSKNEKQEIKMIKSKLKKTRTRLKTWKSVATQFKKKAATLERDIKKISRTKISVKDIKDIKRDLKLEKRKLREQRQDLKTLKNLLRKEHRNYAREGWKLAQTQRKLNKIQVPRNESAADKINCRKKSRKSRKTSRNRRKRKKKKSKSVYRKKRANKNKKTRSKDKATLWENLEKTLKEWTQNLNKTVREKSGGKIKEVWKKLQEKFGKLINFNWTKQHKMKRPLKAKKKQRKGKKPPSDASAIYEKVLAEQREFDLQKRRNMDDSRKLMKSRSPTIVPRKKPKRKRNPETVARQRRRRKQRKYQRELERLEQWALQMNEKKMEHENIYKNRNDEKVDCESTSPKPKESSNSIRNVDAGSVDDSSNLTNTLMISVQPNVDDNRHEEFTKFESGKKEPLENAERVVQDITLAQMKHKREKKKTTGLSVLYDDESVHVQPSQTPFNPTKYEHVEKPTPPLLDPTFYSTFPMLGAMDSHKGGSMILPIPPSNLDPIKHKDAAEDARQSQSRSWDRDKTLEAWIPPPGPLQSDSMGLLERSSDKQNDKPQGSSAIKTAKPHPKPDEKHAYKTGDWMFLRASNRAHQRILYEPLNKQSAKDQSKRKSKKTYFNRNCRKTRDKNGSWMFDRASDREEQRVNKEPWYMRRAEGREDDRGHDQSSWFIERGFDREVQRKEEQEESNDIHDDYYYDDDYDDDYLDYDIDDGYDGYDDIAAA